MSDNKTQRIIDDICRLYGDTSVSHATTRDRLENIRDQVEVMLKALDMHEEVGDEIDFE